MVRSDSGGFVYALECAGRVKIGRAANVTARMRTLNLPFEAVLLKSVEVQDRYWAEKYLHRLFKTRRVRGEWFDFSDTSLDQLFEAMASIPAPPGPRMQSVTSKSFVSITAAAAYLGWSREYFYRVFRRLEDAGAFMDTEFVTTPGPHNSRELPKQLVDWLKINHRKGKPGRKPKKSATETLDDDY